MAFEVIQMAFKNFLAVISGILTAGMQILNGDWYGAWNTIKNTFLTIGGNIVDAGRNVFEALESTIMGIVSRIENFVKGSLTRIKETLKSIVTLGATNVVGKVGNIIDGFKADGGPVES